MSNNYLTIQEAEKLLTATWGHQATVMSARIGGGGYVTYAIDDAGHRMALDHNPMGTLVRPPDGESWPE